jgi:hypothetical protein
LKAVADSYLGTQLSPHKVRSETDGSLICRAVVARSGYQEYRLSELEPESGSSEIVDVYRPPQEVLAPEFLASLEGATITDGHPGTFVNPDNHAWVSRGFAVNAARGPDDEDGNVTVAMDLHLKDAAIIQQVESGKKQLSVGYIYALEHEGGKMVMRNLRANHIAICNAARAGDVAQITDSNIESEENMNTDKFAEALASQTKILERLCGLMERMNSKPKAAEDSECNCGGKKTHSDACPMYSAQAEDMDEDCGDRYRKPDTLGPRVIPVGGGGNERNENPVTAHDYEEALNNLRGIRSIVAASKDVEAIHAYNRAVKDVKRRLHDALMNPPTVGPELLRRAVADARADGEDYEAMCKALHRREVPNVGADATDYIESSKKREARDGKAKQENYEEIVDRARRKALHPKDIN